MRYTTSRKTLASSWCGHDGWCYLFSILDCYTREWLAYTFSTECGTNEAIKTLEMAVLERFPDGVIPSLSFGLTSPTEIKWREELTDKEIEELGNKEIFVPNSKDEEN